MVNDIYYKNTGVILNKYLTLFSSIFISIIASNSPELDSLRPFLYSLSKKFSLSIFKRKPLIKKFKNPFLLSLK